MSDEEKDEIPSKGKTPADKLVDERKKAKKGEIDKQTKVTADALSAFQNELEKLQKLTQEHDALDTDTRAILKRFQM